MNYTGYKMIYPMGAQMPLSNDFYTDTTLSAFYSDPATNWFDCLENQYLVIADKDGKVLYNVTDFEYKSIKEPTVLNVIDYYLSVHEGVKCVIEDDTLVQIGTSNALKANITKGEYWAFMEGTDHDIPAIVKNQTMQNKYFINDQRMATYPVESGDSFTIVIIK